MPKAIIEAVEIRCNAGELKPWEQSLKDKKKMDCHQLGEAIAGMVEARIKNQKSEYLKDIEDFGNDFIVLSYRSKDDFHDNSLHWQLIDPETGVFGLFGKLVKSSAYLDYQGENIACEFKFDTDIWNEKSANSFIEVQKYSQDKGTMAIVGMETIKVGIWNGNPYTLKDLDNLVDAFKDKVFMAGIKLGHNETQKALRLFLDGMPRFGTATAVYRKGDSLYVDWKDIPNKLGDLILKGAFPIRSAEIFYNFKFGEKIYPMVLRNISLFGDEVPAVEGLEQVIEIFQGKAESLKSYSIRTCKTNKLLLCKFGKENCKDCQKKIEEFKKGEGVNKMTPEEIEKMKADNEKLVKEKAGLEKEKSDLAKEKSDLEKFKVDKEAEVKKMKEEGIDKDAVSKVEGLLKTKLTPEAVPFFISIFKALAGIESKVNIYSLKENAVIKDTEEEIPSMLFLKLIESLPENPVIVEKFKEKTAIEKLAETKSDKDASPESVELTQKVEQYLKLNKLERNQENYEVARKAVQE